MQYSQLISESLCVYMVHQILNSELSLTGTPCIIKEIIMVQFLAIFFNLYFHCCGSAHNWIVKRIYAQAFLIFFLRGSYRYVISNNFTTLKVMLCRFLRLKTESGSYQAKHFRIRPDPKPQHWFSCICWIAFSSCTKKYGRFEPVTTFLLLQAHSPAHVLPHQNSFLSGKVGLFTEVYYMFILHNFYLLFDWIFFQFWSVDIDR